MSESFIRMPDDATNLGKFLRAEKTIVNATEVHQEVTTLAKSDGTLLDTQLGNLDIALTALRDGITGLKTLADVVTALGNTLNVSVQNASLAVTGTFWQGTQPVSGPLTDAQLRAAAVPVSGFPADQLVHATNLDVAASTLAKASTQTDGTQKTQITNLPASQVVDDSLTSQTLIDTERQVLQAINKLTIMFAAVFSPNADLGGLMASNSTLAPVMTN